MPVLLPAIHSARGPFQHIRGLERGVELASGPEAHAQGSRRSRPCILCFLGLSSSGYAWHSAWYSSLAPLMKDSATHLSQQRQKDWPGDPDLARCPRWGGSEVGQKPGGQNLIPHVLTYIRYLNESYCALLLLLYARYQLTAMHAPNTACPQQAAYA